MNFKSPCALQLQYKDKTLDALYAYYRICDQTQTSNLPITKTKAFYNVEIFRRGLNN